MNLEDIRYWWEDLELRKKLEESQSIVIIGLLVIILFSLGLVTCQLLGGGGRGSFAQEVELVYYDVTNQSIKIVNHEYPEIPKSPLEGTDDVFIARVFSCEDCPEGQLKDGMTAQELKENNMFIAWLERTAPDVTEEMLMFGEGQEFRTLERDRWYKTTDPAYERVMQAFNKRCKRPYPCMP